MNVTADQQRQVLGSFNVSSGTENRAANTKVAPGDQGRKTANTQGATRQDNVEVRFRANGIEQAVEGLEPIGAKAVIDNVEKAQQEVYPGLTEFRDSNAIVVRTRRFPINFHRVTRWHRVTSFRDSWPSVTAR